MQSTDFTRSTLNDRSASGPGGCVAHRVRLIGSDTHASFIVSSHTTLGSDTRSARGNSGRTAG